MGKKVIKDFSEVVRMFENGSSISEISEKIGVTKQAISSRLKKYYQKNTSVFKKFYQIQVCKVCSQEEKILSQQIPVSELKQLNLRPVEKRVKYICKNCIDHNVYLCTSCGMFAPMESGKFLKKPLSEKNRRARCLECNYKNYKKWREDNREKSRKILREYKKGIRIKRKQIGLCTECGKSRDVDDFFICNTCRKQNRDRYKKQPADC